jgi:hypothetical protein
LEIDDTNGTFTNDGYVTYQQPQQAPTSQPQTPTIPKTLPLESSEKTSSRWPIYVAFIVGIVVTFAVWKLSTQQPSQTAVQPIVAVDTVADTPKEQPKVDDSPAPKPQPLAKETNIPEQQPAKTNVASLSNYELERLAMSGNVEAQCLLGKRWVSLHDSVNVVKGIQYLKLAARNGSTEAKNTLRTVYTALQQSASNGSTTAANILREQ